MSLQTSLLQLVSTATDALSFLPPYTLRALAADINRACDAAGEPGLKLDHEHILALTRASQRRSKQRQSRADTVPSVNLGELR